MNDTLSQVRADRSTPAHNHFSADLTTYVGRKVGGYSIKTMLAKISQKIAHKYYPFRPEQIKMTVTTPLILFDPEGLALLTFQITVENFSEHDINANLLEYDVMIGTRLIFTMEKPLSLRLPETAKTTLNFQIYLTPGVVKEFTTALKGQTETIDGMVRIQMPVTHLLGQNFVNQQMNTSLRIQPRIA